MQSFLIVSSQSYEILSTSRCHHCTNYVQNNLIIVFNKHSRYLSILSHKALTQYSTDNAV